MTETKLKAALYLEAVLGALPLLAAHDPALASALAGPDVTVALFTGGLGARLIVKAGQVSVIIASPQPGDLRLWFPSAAQLVRAFDNSGPALALPLGGWTQLKVARRLPAAGKKMEALLNDRATALNDPARLRLHVWAGFVVGVAAAASWLRHQPEGAAERARLGESVATFSCPEFPVSLWLSPADATWGWGEPPRPVGVAITFATLAVALAELDHRLDSLAALGLGDLRITGKLPLADQLGVIMLRAGNLLRPPAVHP
ncbi:MAG: hypothetical protein JF599_02985 [Verrucomicrobia bacterium]|nr:hypothetical protein [Verrucomicrobiota bacterium]